MSVDQMEVDQEPPNPDGVMEPELPTYKPPDVSALCSAYLQMGPVNMTTRPATLIWTDLGQILCHGAIQVAIATPSHPTPPYVPETSVLNKKPVSRPRPFIISDDTTTIPSETDQAFPLHINKFVMDRVDDDVEEALEQVDVYDSNVGMFHRPRSYTINSLCVSPSNILQSGSPIVTVLDSSLTVKLLTFPKGSVHGSPRALGNLTRDQIKLQGSRPTVPDFDQVSPEIKLEYQNRSAEVKTNCVAWSSAPVFNAPVGPAPGAALLALGNRRCQVQLWSVDEAEQLQQRWNQDVGAGGWITELAWSQWIGVDDNTCRATLALSRPGGGVETLSVKMTRTVHGTHGIVVGEVQPAISADKRPIKMMKWINHVLVVAKIGLVQVFQPEQKVTRTLKLEKLGTWTGCSSTSPCVGIGSLPDSAALVALWSGEMHVITNLATEPTIDFEQSKLCSQAVNEAIHTLDREIVDAQREKQGGELRFTEQFTEDMTLRVVGADVNGTLLGLIFEPWALSKLTVIREGKVRHWIAVADLSKALTKLPDRTNLPYQSYRTPAATLLHRLPGWYHQPPAGLTAEHGDEVDMEMPRAASEEETVNVIDTPDALRYALLWSPSARADQVETVNQLWESVFRKDLTQALNAMRGRTVRINARILQYLIQTLTNQPNSIALNASFLEGWLRDLPMGRGLDEQVIQLTSLVKGMGEVSPEKFDCPICEEALSIREGGDGVAGELVCPMWHVWKRCALTRRLIEGVSSRSCFTCRQQVLRPSKNAKPDDLAEGILSLAVMCPWCGSGWT